MVKRSKRYQTAVKDIDLEKAYDLTEAIQILKNAPPAKFDESVEIALKTGIDPKQSDQQVRGTVILPHGTGKEVRIVVLAKAEKAKEAIEAGCFEAGSDELVEKIKGGWIDFDVVVATPDMMREVGRLGKILGPRGLMPTPKAGTVTPDVAKAIADLKEGRIEFRTDKGAAINNMIGKISFKAEHIAENVIALLQAIVRSKPLSAKGQYLQSCTISTTMGIGLKVSTGSMGL